MCGVQEHEGFSAGTEHLSRHLTDLVTHRSSLQKQPEAVARLLVVFEALTQPTIVILHQPAVHDHLELA